MRPLIKTRLTSALVLTACCAGSPDATAADRPNILWVVSEDNTFNYVGAYGDPLARTPNVDRLATAGVVFDRAYTAPVCAPSRSTIITGRYASSLGTQNMRSTRPLPPGVRFFPEALRAAGYFCTNNDKTDYNTSTSWAQAWDENSQTAHWRHRRPGQSFFAVFNFMQSHESRLLGGQPLVTDPAKVRVPAYLPDTAAVRADLARYYDCVARADAAIGQVLAELKADGLADDTIVFYYSDNGGAAAGSKRFLNEAGTHVALIAHFPEKFRQLAPGAPGTHSAELVNYVDLAPTVLSLAGVPALPQFQGRAFAGAARSAPPEFTYMFADRMDERYNLSRAVTDGRYRYIRNYYPDRPWGQRVDFLWQLASTREWELHHTAGVLAAAQRRFFEPSPAEALFDCEADPDNVHDLSTEPGQAARLQRMRTALREHLLQIRDTGFMPEPMMIEAAASGSPAVIAGSDDRYPLARLLELLDGLQLGPPLDAGKDAMAAAHDPLAVVRYWSAVAALRGEPATYVESLLEDSDAIVRVTAAEALLRRSEHPAAMQVLEAAVRQARQPELRLFALDAFVRTKRDCPQTLAPLIGQFAASDEFGGFNYYFARLARLLLADHGGFSFRLRAQEAPRPGNSRQ